MLSTLYISVFFAKSRVSKRRMAYGKTVVAEADVDLTGCVALLAKSALKLALLLLYPWPSCCFQSRIKKSASGFDKSLVSAEKNSRGFLRKEAAAR